MQADRGIPNARALPRFSAENFFRRRFPRGYATTRPATFCRSRRRPLSARRFRSISHFCFANIRLSLAEGLLRDSQESEFRRAYRETEAQLCFAERCVGISPQLIRRTRLSYGFQNIGHDAFDWVARGFAPATSILRMKMAKRLPLYSKRIHIGSVEV